MLFYRRFSATGAKGFTIIELLVALGVLAIIIGIGAQVFLSISGGFVKSSAIASLQETGSRVISEISRTIRDGKKVEDISGAPSCAGAGLQVTLLKESLEYTANGNCEVVIFCQVPTDGSTYNSYIEKRLPVVNCVGTPTGAGELTNKDPQNGVHVAALTFNVSGGTNRAYLTEIELQLTQGINAPVNKTSQATVELKNSVSTRNY